MSSQPNLSSVPNSVQEGAHDYNYILAELYLRAYGNLLDGTIAITDEIEQDYLRATKFKTFSENPRYNASVQAEYCAVAKYILIEATLKCYKLLFLSIQEDLLNYSHPLTIYLCTRNNNEYQNKFKKFIDFAEQADKVELTGRPILAIDLIKESVRIGYELQGSIDTGLANTVEKINAKLIVKFLMILILMLTLRYILPYLIIYGNPIIIYISSLEGIIVLIVSIVASLIAVILSELYKFIRKAL